MRALIQRVSTAEVNIAGRSIAQINHGLVIFVCAMKGDSEQNAVSLAKIVMLRIFGDDAGKMNRSLLDVKDCALVVSQFTLAANMSHGNRPSFLRPLWLMKVRLFTRNLGMNFDIIATWKREDLRRICRLNSSMMVRQHFGSKQTEMRT